jgi:hypothetical protein
MKTLTIALAIAFGALLGLVPAIAADAPETSPEASTSVPVATTTLAPAQPAQPLLRDLETPDGQSCPGWMDLAREVGWPETELPMVGAVTYFESRCRMDVRGDNGVSWTAFQIHTKSWCLPSKYYPNGYLQTIGLVSTCDNLLDPPTAARAALAIWEYGTWTQWTTHKLASNTLTQ